LSEAAVADLSRRSRVLRQHRGTEFARAWVAGFFAWLRGCAGSGAQLGTEHPRHPGFRTFGYRRQATLLVEYGEGELRVIRIYFAGQDWTQ
jgi:plasmid stabilization system protein ParE